MNSPPFARRMPSPCAREAWHEDDRFDRRRAARAAAHRAAPARRQADVEKARRSASCRNGCTVPRSAASGRLGRRDRGYGTPPDRLSLRCCSGTPPSAHNAFCRPSASATKLSPPSTTWACAKPRRHGGMTELEEAELTEGQGPRSLGTQDRAGLSRLCQGDDAARTCRDTQAHAHLLAQRQLEEQSSTEFPNAGRSPFPHAPEKPRENKDVSVKNSMR